MFYYLLGLLLAETELDAMAVSLIAQVQVPVHSSAMPPTAASVWQTLVWRASFLEPPCSIIQQSSPFEKQGERTEAKLL